MKWNFLTSENAGATHSNAFTVSTASVHLPIFLVEDRWLICCWKCSQIQADLCSKFSSIRLLDYPCIQEKVPEQCVIGYHRPMVGLLKYVQYIGPFYYKVAMVGILYPPSHQLGAYRKSSGCTRPPPNPLASTGASLYLMLRHTLELGTVATAGSLPIHMEILQKLKM